MPRTDYRGLARKYRPRRFSEVVGQEHVTRTLLNAVRLNKVHHAYIFAGSRGIGKTTVARILAKALNCKSPQDGEPCSQCPSCLEIDGGRSVDVLEIDGASYTQVENIREIQEIVRYAPARGKYRVVIIDEVHMLSRSAFNALLKTVEEPPAHVIFVFATTEVNRVPDTVVSRCHRFDFRRIPSALMKERLISVAEEEGIKVEERALDYIIKEANGSLRDGLSLLEQVVSYSGNEVSVKDVEIVLGLPPAESVIKVIEKIIERDPRGALETAEYVMQMGVDAVRFAREIASGIRDCLMLKEGAGRRSEVLEEFSQLVEKASTEDFINLYRACLVVLDDIYRSPVAEHALEVGLVKMAHLPRLETLSEILGHISSSSSERYAVKKNTSRTPSETKALKAEKEAPAPESTLNLQARRGPTNRENDFESTFFSVLRKKSKMTADLLERELVSVSVEKNEVIFYVLPDSPLLAKDVNGHRVKNIELAVREVLGYHVDVHVRASGAKSDYEKDMEEKIRESDVIKKFQSELSAQLINIHRIKEK